MAQWGLKVPEGQASCYRQKQVGKQRGWGCRLRAYLAFTVDLGPSIDQDLHNLQVTEPGRQEKCVHPKLGERTQEGEEEGRRQRCGCGCMAKPFIYRYRSVQRAQALGI